MNKESEKDLYGSCRGLIEVLSLGCFSYYDVTVFSLCIFNTKELHNKNLSNLMFSLSTDYKILSSAM
jgi:hypothetical protein